ncbi:MULTISPECIES: glycosyltransferase [Niastella]|uniref:Alpha 1,4-glycosyltransferase domain-containing protein n=1 Tax=Niastella soli TaxID=2821487 RepID=A0ABS3YNJ4_9BACT|nr:glycosyltransferase [Niastella soli]MBO9199015.1 hypothetical protein [Niastella soli]
MIPKIIHYCWFGEDSIPVEQMDYIEDWKKRHPDWQFIFWNKDNAPLQIPYLKKAEGLRKWANMSNYVRLYAIKEHGGIYLDTDIKLVKDLTSLLDNDCFYGFEEFNAQDNTFWVNNAIFGAKKDHDFITSCHNELLVKFDGSEEANLSSPRLTTELLIRLKNLSDYKEQLLGDIKLYPIEYFYPIHYSEAYKINEFEKYIFPETIAVHVWARTWVNKKTLIEAFDFLRYKTSEQEKYISTLQKTIQQQESTANEIYYWKQHFENEFNNLKLHQEKDQIIIEYQRTYTEIVDIINNIQEKVSDLLKWNNTLEKLSETITIQNDLLIKRIELLEDKIHHVEDKVQHVEDKIQHVSIEIDKKAESQSQEFKAIHKDIQNISFINLFTNIFKKKKL